MQHRATMSRWYIYLHASKEAIEAAVVFNCAGDSSDVAELYAIHSACTADRRRFVCYVGRQ